MIKKGIVKAVQPNGSWEGKFGVMYKYEVTIGEDTGEYSGKSAQQDKFVIGQEVDYEVTEQGNFGKKIKPVSNFQAGGGASGSSGATFSGGSSFKTSDADRQMMIVKQSSLHRAVDMLIAEKIPKKDVLKIAQSFTDWVMSKEKPAVEKPTVEKVNVKTPINSSSEPLRQVEAFVSASAQTDNDLPF
jgi:hypothetical protein